MCMKGGWGPRLQAAKGVPPGQINPACSTNTFLRGPHAAPCRRFYSELIKFRREHPLLGRAEVLTNQARRAGAQPLIEA